MTASLGTTEGNQPCSSDEEPFWRCFSDEEPCSLSVSSQLAGHRAVAAAGCSTVRCAGLGSRWATAIDARVVATVGRTGSRASAITEYRLRRRGCHVANDGRRQVTVVIRELLGGDAE